MTSIIYNLVWHLQLKCHDKIVKFVRGIVWNLTDMWLEKFVGMKLSCFAPTSNILLQTFWNIINRLTFHGESSKVMQGYLFITKKSVLAFANILCYVLVLIDYIGRMFIQDK